MSSTQVAIFTQRSFSVQFLLCGSDEWQEARSFPDKAKAFEFGQETARSVVVGFRVVENVFNRFVVEE